MRVGDIVRWIGFPGADPHDVNKIIKRVYGDFGKTGIVLKIYEAGVYKFRVDVQWGDGTFGECLYPQTIEVVSGDR